MLRSALSTRDTVPSRSLLVQRKPPPMAACPGESPTGISVAIRPSGPTSAAVFASASLRPTPEPSPNTSPAATAAATNAATPTSEIRARRDPPTNCIRRFGGRARDGSCLRICCSSVPRSAVASIGQEPLEAAGVDLVVRDAEDVSGRRLGDEHAGRQHLPQLRHVELQRLVRRPGRSLAPDLVDQALERDDFVAV